MTMPRSLSTVPAIFALVLAIPATTLRGEESESPSKFPEFTEQVIDPHAGEIVYAVIHADVNDDDRLDIVAVTEDALFWYENPEWKKHLIIEDGTTRDNVCIAAQDIDGDGHVDFALGAGWATSGGTIQWLERGESLDEEWTIHLIGAIPWTHRMRFGDVLGTGQPQLVVAPLNKTEREGVALTAFSIPADPATDRWPTTLIDHSLNRMHNHWIVPQADGPDALLTASKEGVTLFRKSKEGGFTKKRLSSEPAGEVKYGIFGKDLHLLATIEPMHGNRVVAAIGKGLDSGDWTRHVLDETLGRGHALWLADVDHDGFNEIVVGHSKPATGPIPGPGIYVYDAQNSQGTSWKKHVIDTGEIAVEDAFAIDMTGDGRPDIVAGGRATHNIKIYVNQGAGK